MGSKIDRSIPKPEIARQTQSNDKLSDADSRGHNRQQVYHVVSSIPYGKVTSYGAVARLAGLGKGARFVGYVLKNLPKGSTLPWHRVLNSQGKVSLPLGSPSFNEQIRRLRAEGILVKSGKVKLKYYLWQA